MSERHQNVYAITRTATEQLLKSLSTLRDLRVEWNALDYGNTLADERTTGLTHTEVGAVVFATGEAVETLLATGHYTNLYKIL